MRHLHNRLDLCSINTGTLGYQTPISETIEAVARQGFGAICPSWRVSIPPPPPARSATPA